MLSDRCPVCLSVTFVHCGQTVGRIKIKLGTQIGLGPGHVVLDGDTAPPPSKGCGSCPQFSAYTCCGQMAARIKMPLGMELGWPRRLCVRWGPRSPPQKWGEPLSNFWLMFIGPNGWMDQDGTWHGGRPQPRRHCVRWGPSPPPQFSAHFYCGQTAACIKLPLGMEVCRSPGDFVLDGDLDQDVTW